MTLEQMEIVRNMLGFLHTPRKTYRNRFYVGAGGPDETLKQMEETGIVERMAEGGGARIVYRVTDRWLDAMGVEVQG